MNNKTMKVQSIKINKKKASNLLKKYPMSSMQAEVINFTLDLMNDIVENNYNQFKERGIIYCLLRVVQEQESLIVLMLYHSCVVL